MKNKMTMLIIAMGLFAFSHTVAQLPGFEWAGQMGGDSSIFVSSVTTDYLGNIIITGAFKGQADIDPGPVESYILTSNGNSDIFILKLDAAGNFLWASSMGDYNFDQGTGVITDAAGNIYLTGQFIGTIDADPGSGVYIMSQQRVTTMILKINPEGNLIWGKYFGQANEGHCYSYAITLDNSGNIITSGSFYGRADFDPGPGTFQMTSTSGSNDGFIHKVDPSGNFIWVKQIAGNDLEIPYSILTDNSGQIYSTGYFKGTADFNPDRKLKYNLSSFGDSDAFYLKLNSSGSFVWARQVGGILQDRGHDMVMDESGNLFATGSFYGTADFDPGSGVYNLTSNGQNDAFILKLNSSGGFAWAKNFGGAAYEAGFGIRMDADANLYVGSFFYGTIDADPGSGTYYITSEGMDDALVQKLTSDGNLIWASQTGGAGWDYNLELAVDGAGNIINTGGFGETVDMNPQGGGEFFLSNGDTLNNDMFIQKLNPSGYNCYVPNGLAAANITTTSADLSWSPVSGYTGNYNIRYREIGETWIISEMVSVPSITLTGLTPATGYEFQVRTACPGNYSYSFNFTTTGGCQDIYEPNETIATAAPIAVTTNVFGLIYPQYDIDHFSFSTTNSAKNVTVTLTDLPADYNLYLYKSNGTLLASSTNEGLADESIVYNTNKVGSYVVRITGTYGAFDPANCYTLLVTTSSGAKSADATLLSENNSFSVYPNPANEVLNVQVGSTDKSIANLSIINTSGQRVYNSDLQVDEGLTHLTVPVNNLKPGLYMVRLVTTEGVLVRKVMISR